MAVLTAWDAADEFQFRLVRLKPLGGQSGAMSSAISIPLGPIEAALLASILKRIQVISIPLGPIEAGHEPWNTGVKGYFNSAWSD